MESSLDNEETGLDPALENLREEALAGERVNYEAMVASLCQQVQQVHCSYLFHFQGKEALRKICQCISSTPADTYHISWKDLAGYLGLSLQQIGCIENYKDDMTESTLKVFARKLDASLAHLAVAFLKIERFDCVAIAAEKFPALADFAKKDCADFAKKDFTKWMGKCNNEYNTSEGNDKETRLIRPEKSWDHQLYQLKITLEDEEYHQQKKKLPENPFGDIERRINVVKNVCSAPRVTPSKKVTKKKRIMLTFASDCQDIADYVASQFRMLSDNNFKCGVLLLREHPEKVATSPYDFITHHFYLADYIIPILSRRYFERLCDDDSNQLYNAEDNLDESNIKLLVTLMQHFYYYNKCINTKIRCIIPMRFQESVFKEKHFKMNPIFKAYVFDNPKQIKELVINLGSLKSK